MSDVNHENVRAGIVAAGASDQRARGIACLIYHGMVERGIITPLRAAAYLAQLGHESGGFARLTENLNYSWQALRRTWPRRYPTDASAQALHRKPELIANHVYGGRMGNLQPGDGWRYRGRGYIQLTGRDNYAEAEAALGLPLLSHPDLLTRPAIASEVSAWWWEQAGCNALADAGDIEALTRRINGGLTGIDSRRRLYGAVKGALGI
jgi:putative chitinase